MIKENQVLDEAEHSIKRDSPGQLLQKRRNQTGLSIEEVAARLCLRHSVIESIEADDYTGMSGMVFARGYLRSYARLLHLDGDEVISAFNSLGLEDEQSEKNLWQAPKSSKSKESPVKWLVLVVAICALVLAGLWWQANKQLQPNFSALSVDKRANDKTELEPQLPELERIKHTAESLPESEIKQSDANVEISSTKAPEPSKLEVKPTKKLVSNVKQGKRA